MSRIFKPVSISLEPELKSAALERAHELGFGTSFSAYVAKLIRDDVKKSAAATPVNHQRQRDADASLNESVDRETESAARRILLESKQAVDPLDSGVKYSKRGPRRK